MSSGDFLRKSNYFDPSDQPWPAKDMKIDLAWAKLGSAPWEHWKRVVFHYGVFTFDEMQQLGGFTVGYSRSPDYKAQVNLWVRESTVKQGEDREIFEFIKEWLASDWPLDLKEIAFPGWEHDWAPFSRGKLVPDDFQVPDEIYGAGSYFCLMGMNEYLSDYYACFEDVSHLQGMLGPDEPQWPATNVNPSVHMGDMGWAVYSTYQRHFFSYAIYTEDRSRVRGSVYIHPTTVEGYDAELITWVIKEDYDSGYDQELFEWAKQWVESDWCFDRFGCPGRDINWEIWRNLPEKQRELTSPGKSL
jgi:hypothetical protein